jgi:hypothetical protein
LFRFVFCLSECAALSVLVVFRFVELVFAPFIFCFLVFFKLLCLLLRIRIRHSAQDTRQHVVTLRLRSPQENETRDTPKARVLDESSLPPPTATLILPPPLPLTNPFNIFNVILPPILFEISDMTVRICHAGKATSLSTTEEGERRQLSQCPHFSRALDSTVDQDVMAILDEW